MANPSYIFGDTSIEELRNRIRDVAEWHAKTMTLDGLDVDGAVAELLSRIRLRPLVLDTRNQSVALSKDQKQFLVTVGFTGSPELFKYYSPRVGFSRDVGLVDADTFTYVVKIGAGDTEATITERAQQVFDQCRAQTLAQEGVLEAAYEAAVEVARPLLAARVKSAHDKGSLADKLRDFRLK